MSDVGRVVADPWVRGWLVGGCVMAAVAAISSLPWPLWIGWAYLGVLCLLDARRGIRRDTRRDTRGDARRDAPRDVAHTTEEPGVWQTRPDE